jgi:hypothetical protein
MHTNGRIYAFRWQDHPEHGDGPKWEGNFLLTGTVLWINRELGMARTARTLYKLMEGERK